MPNQPADCRDAVHWFIDNVGLYLGSARGLFVCDFSDELEALLEAAIISLRQRGLKPLTISGDQLYKQAEYLWPQAVQGTTFGRPMASEVELDIGGAEVLILKDIEAPENPHHLWYLYHHVLYPRALSNKPTVITTPLGQDEFSDYGAACEDIEYAGRKVTWEKLLWLLDATCIDMPHFKLMKEEGLTPMLKPEYYLYKALKERDLNVHPHHVVGDYMLDFGLAQRDRKLNIEVDVVSSLDAVSAHSWEAKRSLLLLNDGWNILRFTNAEIMSNLSGCVDAAIEVWQQGRKKSAPGRQLSGNQKTTVPELPVDDDTQRLAITHGGGPAAIEGGAGTGKTSCIVHRVAYLLAQGVTPEKILVVSHSQETTRGLKTLVETIADRQLAQRVSFYSWNDLGMKILKENLAAIKRKPPLKIESNPQKVIQRLVGKHKKELDPLMLEISEELDEFTLGSLISLYKANLISPKFLKEKAQSDLDEMVAKVYQGYEDQLQKSNRIDRDDMVSLAALVLADHEEIRARYQYQFDYVVVDEYQDATAAGDLLVRLLALPQDNLYVAGNEDEAIYESKGGLPRLMAEVSIRLPNARCYILDKNWRSHPGIVEHAKLLLNGLQRRRIKKDMISGWSTPATTAIIGPQVLESESLEAEWVADETLILIDSGRGPQDIAVLYRYHRYGIIIEEALSRRGVRCVTTHPEAGLIPDEVGDVMAFLKLVMDPDGPKARESFERVCQLRVKEVDPKLSGTIASFAEANNLSYLKAVEIYSEAVAEQSCRDLEQLVRIIRTMNQENLPPAETISLLKRTQRLSDFYKSVKVPPGVNYEPLRKLTQLEEEARKYKSVSEFVKAHSAAGKQGGDGKSEDKVVHILTLHEAKGKEFPVIFLVGLAEGLFPAESATDREEERRLCYVGMTRAKELLYLSYPSMFNNVALNPSSFLMESRLLSFQPPPPEMVPLAPQPPMEVAPPPPPPPPKPVIKKVAAVSVQAPLPAPGAKPQPTAPAQPPVTAPPVVQPVQPMQQPVPQQVPQQQRPVMPQQPAAQQMPPPQPQIPQQPPPVPQQQRPVMPQQPAAQQMPPQQHMPPPQPQVPQQPPPVPQQQRPVMPQQPVAQQMPPPEPMPQRPVMPQQPAAQQMPPPEPMPKRPVMPQQPVAQQMPPPEPIPQRPVMPQQPGAQQMPPPEPIPQRPVMPQQPVAQQMPPPESIPQRPVMPQVPETPQRPAPTQSQLAAQIPTMPQALPETPPVPDKPAMSQSQLAAMRPTMPQALPEPPPEPAKPAMTQAQLAAQRPMMPQAPSEPPPEPEKPAMSQSQLAAQRPTMPQGPPADAAPTAPPKTITDTKLLDVGSLRQGPFAPGQGELTRPAMPSLLPNFDKTPPAVPDNPVIQPHEGVPRDLLGLKSLPEVPPESQGKINAYSQMLFPKPTEAPTEADIEAKLEELPSWPPAEGQLTQPHDPAAVEPSEPISAEPPLDEDAPKPEASGPLPSMADGTSPDVLPPPLARPPNEAIIGSPPPMSANDVASALRSGMDDLVSGSQSLAPAIEHNVPPKKGKGKKGRQTQETALPPPEPILPTLPSAQPLPGMAASAPDRFAAPPATPTPAVPPAPIPPPEPVAPAPLVEPQPEPAPPVVAEEVAAPPIPSPIPTAPVQQEVAAPTAAADEGLSDVPDGVTLHKPKRSVPSDGYWNEKKKSSEGTAIGDIWTNPDMVQSTLHQEIQPQEQVKPQPMLPPMQSAPPVRPPAQPVTFEDDPEGYFEQMEPETQRRPAPQAPHSIPAQDLYRQPNQYDQNYAQPPAAPAPVYDVPDHLPVCQGCGAPLEAGSRFCGECGFQLEVRIPSCHLCGAPLDPAAKFCGECGSKRVAAQPAHAGQVDLSQFPPGDPNAERFKQYIDKGGKPTQHGWLVKFLKKLEQ